MQQLHRHRVEHLVAHDHAAQPLGQGVDPLHLGRVDGQALALALTQCAGQFDNRVALDRIAERVKQLQRQCARPRTELPHLAARAGLQALRHLAGQRLAEQG